MFDMYAKEVMGQYIKMQKSIFQNFGFSSANVRNINKSAYLPMLPYLSRAYHTIIISIVSKAGDTHIYVAMGNHCHISLLLTKTIFMLQLSRALYNQVEHVTLR